MKKNIAIIMGGYTSEYEISFASGNTVYDLLDKQKYNCYKIHILKDRWVYVNDFNEVEINRKFFTIQLKNKSIKFDCVFNAIHGAPGENGEIQEYFKKLNIPITGSDSFQSKITYDKIECLNFLKKHNIKTAKSCVISKGDKIDVKKICNKIGLPCFVKASKSGSSYGVSKVYKEEDFLTALEIAFKEDSNVLIEEYLDGTEISVGVISFKNEIICLPITEIVSDNDFFDYEAKYKGQSKEITPARISDEMMKNAITESKKIYSILNLKGFSRSEFIFKTNTPYLLEINTVPGLTKQSILPQQLKLAGIKLEELFDNVINEALN
ncbi:MAG: D-alanine--D-alanine ligase [Flavobacteriaceae bacterium]|nr:D-alanine--D-alanine ligase [Flavobacteriaceae bacterium]